MRFHVGVGVVALFVSAAFAGEFKSGPQVGDSISPFHPMNVTGKAAGQKNCLI